MSYNKIIGAFGAIVGILSGCGSLDTHEETTYGDEKPIYCYQSLAGVECFKKPNHRDKRRIVNFYGPHPTQYAQPKEIQIPGLKAPKEINYWVKDPEPSREEIIKWGSE